MSAAAPTAKRLTASTVVAQPLSGSHVFRIDGYSRTKGFGQGNCITYTISLLDLDGKPAHSSTQRYSFGFDDERRESGFRMFITRKRLEESAYLKDDVFRVRCDVTVIKDVVRRDIPPRIVVPPSDMHGHFGRLLSTGQGADVTFEVGTETFAAHRCVLAARSPVFMAELFGPMKEKTTTTPVRIGGMEARVFEAMLHFIYTDSLPDMDKDNLVAMAQHLLVAADRYSLDRLKLICEDKLSKHIDTNTMATTLALPEQHGCRALKEECFSFLRSPGNMKAIMASDGFEHLKNSCPSIFEELVIQLAP